MIKALLIVTALTGGGDYTVEMPSMQSCLDARETISEQDVKVKTLCVPFAGEIDKMARFFDVFMSLVIKMKELENEYPTAGMLNNECSNCTK